MPDYGISTDAGRLRADNQDAWRADPDAGLFLVSDGMGGARGGGAASRAVAEIFPKTLARRLAALPKETRKTVEDAVKESVAEFSAGLRERASSVPELKGMGATLALALIRKGWAYFANIGDSRVYLLDKGRLRRLTKDHSIVAVMLKLGQLTSEEAAAHPARHSLSRYVGMEGRAVADAGRVRATPGRRLLLCTDGLSNMVPDSGLRDVLAGEEDPESACRSLVAMANEAGGEDNITAMVVALGGGP